MIYEYAIDPELIIKWAKEENRRDYREFINAFGIGTTRIPSIVKSKKKWRNYIMQKTSGFSEGENNRVTELINTIFESNIERPICISEPHEWCKKTMKEYQRIPFDYIFIDDIHKQKCNTIKTITLDDINKYYKKVWCHPTQKLVPRTESEMSKTIENMLRLSSHIIIIDPYLWSDWEQKKLPLIKKFLEASLLDRISDPYIEVEIIYSSHKSDTETRGYDKARRCTSQFIHDTLIKSLKKLSIFVNLTVKDIFEIPGGAKIHNRYILTDIGGVIIGSGLETSSENHEDEFILLEKELRYNRWKEYNLNFAFNIYDCFPK